MFLAFAGTFIACDVHDPPVPERLPAIIQVIPWDTLKINIRDSLPVNVTDTVTVLTLGGGCSSEGDTEVHAQSVDVFVIRPYDYRIPRESRGGTICPADIRWFSHQAPVMFTERGHKQIFIVGQEGSGDTLMAVRSILTVY